LHFIKSLQDEGIDPKSEFKLRIAYLGAEPHSDETRLRVEAALGVQAFNSYGLSEMNGPGVAFECTQKHGMHVWEDNFLIEIINPTTLEPVKEGEVGEIVFTTLKREGMPLLRYRSKDIAAVITEPCPCGRTHRRLSRIKGRTDDMLIVKGVNMYPVQIEKTLMAIPQVGSNYLIQLDHKDFNDHMIVKVEVRAEMFHGDLKELQVLRKIITENLRSELLVTPEVELVEPGTLPRSEGKAVRVVDNRKQWG
jgi:phenylacetate-CoA ligase